MYALEDVRVMLWCAEMLMFCLVASAIFAREASWESDSRTYLRRAMWGVH